jgi:hypothetical protein
MRAVSKAALAAASLCLLSGAAAAAMPAWVGDLASVGYALGYIMMVFMGVKWIVADSPNDRAEAKKGILYIVIGLLIIASATDLLNRLYCTTAVSSIGSNPCV